MSKSMVKQRKLGIEGLEQRQMLAGNVSAGLDVSGNLVLNGDLESNHVVVTKGFFPNQLVVSGGRSVSDNPNSATLINGQATPLTFSTSGGLVLNMERGDDRVLLTNVGLIGNLIGTLGGGDDLLALQSSSQGPVSFTLNNGNSPQFGKASVSGFVNVQGHNGDDTFVLYDATISGNLTMRGGDGRDLFNFTGTTHKNSVVGGSVQLLPGGGNDTINIFRMAVGNSFRVDDGWAASLTRVTLNSLRVNFDILMNLSIRRDVVRLMGEDAGSNRFQARNVTINTGDGIDSVSVWRGVMVNLTVSTGAGSEVDGANPGVRLNVLAINTQLFLDTGSGNDDAYLGNINVKTLRVNMESGSDRVRANFIDAADAIYSMAGGADFVSLQDSSYELLSVFLGDQDDVLQARNVSVTDEALFDGGLGVNTYRDRGGNIYRRLTRVSI